MAGAKGNKGAAAKAAAAKAAKAAAAAAAAADDDDEPWVVDMQTHVPLDKQETTEFDPIPLPDLPSLGEHDDETEEARKGRYAEDDAVIAEARKIRESRAVLGAKIAKGPYGVDKRKSHWDYVLIEMRWMAADFAAERDWRLEAARQCAEMSAACEGAPPAREETSEEAALEEAGRAMCARVAHEVGHFWEKAWKRAVEKPIPTAAELVPEPKDDDGAKDGETGPDDKKEDEGKEGGRASRRAAAAAAETATPPKAEKTEPTVEATPEKKDDKAPNPNGDEAADGAAPMDVAGAEDTAVKAEGTGGDGAEAGDDAVVTPTPMAMVRSQSVFPKTPPPPPGMSVIEQWAVLKLTGDIARLKKSIIKKAIQDKEDEENASKKGKKGGRKPAAKGGKKTAAAPSRRGRRGKEEESEEESEDDEED